MNSQNIGKRLLVAFDMDGTLIDGRLIFALADRFGLSDKVREIQADYKLQGYEQSRIIARLLKGLTAADIRTGIESIKLIKNCESLVRDLKEEGHVVGIISDSYDIAANYIAGRLGFDFCEANTLELDGNGKLTGNIYMPLGWQKIGCYCKISVCKRYFLERNVQKFHIAPGSTVAVGDTKSDMCMIQKASLGIAFMPKHKILEQIAAVSIKDPDLGRLKQYF
jgi:phosphoserine phosphatase